MKKMKDKYKNKKIILKTDHTNPFTGSFCDWYGMKEEAVVTFVTTKEHLYSKWKNQCVSFDHSVCDHEGDSFPGFVPSEENGWMKVPDNCHPKRIVDHSKFDKSKLKGPGAYLDGVHYEDEDLVDESYTIIVPSDNLAKKWCEEGLEKLNDIFSRNFELEVDGNE